MQTALNVKMWSKDGWDTITALSHIGAGLCSVTLMFFLLTTLFSYASRIVALSLNATFLTSYTSLFIYHWVRHEPLTYLILSKNGGDLFSWAGLTFTASNVSTYGWVAILIFAVGCILMHRKFGIFNSPDTTKYRLTQLCFLVLANVILAATLPNKSNEYVELIVSTYTYFKPNELTEVKGAAYPYQHSVPKDQEVKITNDSQKPHVFIVMLESFSANYMNRIENGKPVTPFIDSLKDTGLFVENFFSASVETCKGQFATLCSVYPSYRTNVFPSYSNNNFRCLPEILKENGYTNIFMQAYHDLEFENTGSFLLANDFDFVRGMDDTFISKEEKDTFKFGWGIQDDIFYKKMFSYLDTLHNETKLDQRFFVTAASITNHMMFDKIPNEQKFIYPKAKSHHENYTNSIHLSDRYLRQFFLELGKRDYLKNSIIVIQGDNGFPMGQHRNNYHNTKTAYNEMFKMPLLILWDGKIQPQVLKDNAYSQLDIAPTLLELIGVKTSNHFVGTSILQAHDNNYFVPLIQPFDGTYLASIRFPYKYIKNLKTEQEELFNIKTDPAEKINLIEEDLPEKSILLQNFSLDLNRLHDNEVLLAENRIYPKSAADNIRIRLDHIRVAAGTPLGYQILGVTPENYKVVVTLNTYEPLTNKHHTQSITIESGNPQKIPGKLLALGLNRVSLKLYDGDSLLASADNDVFVETNTVNLLTDLPVTGTQGWGVLVKNGSVRNVPLTVGGTRFDFGLGTHAPSDHAIELNGMFSILRIGFGLDDEATCGDGADFSIWADDSKLYEAKSVKNKTHQEVSLDVAGYNTLYLRTFQGGNGNCDHIDWTNPILVKSPNTSQTLQIKTSLDDRPYLLEDEEIEVALEPEKQGDFTVLVINEENHREYFIKATDSKISLPNSLLLKGKNKLKFHIIQNDSLLKRLSRDAFFITSNVTRLETLPHKSEQDWGALKIGSNIDNNVMTIGSKPYEFGFGTHSNSKIDIHINRKYSQLFTGFGLDDDSTCGDGAVFKIDGDGRTLFSSGLLKNGETKFTTINISQIENLSLIVEKGGHNHCDHANWVLPSMVRK